jgi:DNA polymerase-3 subunit epsilon
MAVLAIYDCETTGLDSQLDDVIQLASYFHRFDSTVTPLSQYFIGYGKPTANITEEALKTHKISEDYLADKCSSKDMVKSWWEALLEFSKGEAIILSGYRNQGFDDKFIRKYLGSNIDKISGNLDVFRLVRLLVNDTEDQKLETIYKAVVPIQDRKELQAHDAMSDVQMTTEVLGVLCDKHLGHAYEKIAKRLEKPLILQKMPFGKHKGKDFKTIPYKYLDWLWGQDWLDEDLMESLKEVGYGK